MRTDDKSQKIDAILNAAERVFARYGYQQANMELLAREAGLSRQGLYLSYRSKVDVFSAMVERIQKESLEDALHAATQAKVKGENSVEIVTTLICKRANAFLARLQDSPYVTELNEECGRVCPEIVNEYSRKFVASVAVTIESELKMGKLSLPKGVSAQKAGQLIVSAARGMKLSNPPPSPSEFKRDLKVVVSLFLTEK